MKSLIILYLSITFSFLTSIAGSQEADITIGEIVHGTLDDQDFPYQGHLFDVYLFKGIEGQEIFFNLSSFEFDALLWLLNDEGQVIAIDDDTGDTMGALISRFSLPYTGTYLIAVGSHDAGETGAYTLSLNEAPWVNYSGDPEEIFIGEQVSGHLTHSSPQFRTGQFFNAYRFEASPGQAISIEMHSEQFNSYLWLLNSNGRVITVNDNKSGQSTTGSSEIVFFPPVSGSYFIGASSSDPFEVGEYELILQTIPQLTKGIKTEDNIKITLMSNEITCENCAEQDGISLRKGQPFKDLTLCKGDVYKVKVKICNSRKETFKAEVTLSSTPDDVEFTPEMYVIDNNNTNSCNTFDLEIKTEKASAGEKVITATVKERGSNKELGRDSENLTVVGVEITKPKGSASATVIDDSFIDNALPYRYDWQGVISKIPGSYTLTINGNITSASYDGYKWTLDPSCGSFADADTASPTHIPPEDIGDNSPDFVECSLILKAMKGTTETGLECKREVRIYKDHLARDMANFLSANIQDSRDFMMPGGNNNIGFVCHASTAHANKGETGCSPFWENNNFYLAKKVKVRHDPTKGNGSHDSLGKLDRGDIVAYYDKYDKLMHSQTCTGNNTETFGANNEPMPFQGQVKDQTWKWVTSIAGDWANKITDPYMPVTIKVFKPKQ